jgi:hypothetical protein
MPYGTTLVDTIESSGNLSVTGNVSTSGNLSVTGNLTTTGTITTSNFISSNALGMRNRIINGAMMIDQRNNGSSQTITAAAALAYTVDRWYAYCTGANVTGQQVAGSGGNLYAYRFTGAASVTAIGFGQRIESFNSADLAGSTATLSVDLANSLLTTVTWTAFYANTTDTFGTLASPTRTQIATGTFTVSSTLTRYSTQISIPGAATTGIEIVFTVGAQTSGTWTIDNVQLEAGTVATPFERRQFGQELSLCQRYYFQTAPNANPGAIMVGGTESSTVAAVGMVFPVTMRIAPNVTLNCSFYSFASGVRIPTLLQNRSSTTNGAMTLTITGATGGQACYLFTGSSVAYAAFSSEL